MGRKNKGKNSRAGQRRTGSQPQSPITKEPSEVPGVSTSEMVSNPPISAEQAKEINVEPVVVPDETVNKVDEKTSDDKAVLVTQPENVDNAPVESAVVVDENQVEEQTKPAEVVNEESKVIEEPKQQHSEIEEGQTEEKVVEKEEEGGEEEDVKEVEAEVEKKEGEEEHVDKEDVEGESSQTEEDGVIKRKESCQTDNTIENESVDEPEPEVFTKYTWEKTDEEVNIKQMIFVKSYNMKFAVFLQVINPEFRYVSRIGPCETFDSDGVKMIFDKMKELGFDNPCPFLDENFSASPEEMRLFLSEVLNHVKFCLNLACCQRGYEYKNLKLKNQPISAVWGAKECGLDPLSELKTIKAIIEEVEEPISKLLKEGGQEARHLAELKTTFEEILPALESLDSKKLAEHSISDGLAALHGRKEAGLIITEADVDEMLVRSFTEDGFGEFPSTVLYAPTLFTSIKQLKSIYEQLEKMSKVIDIRIKLAGVQAITRILHLIDEDDVMGLMEEYKDHPKLPVEKVFGINPLEFSVNNHDPKRLQYMKIFYTALGEANPKDDFVIKTHQLSAVFKCFYMVFPAFEINMILFKILGTRNREFPFLDTDRKLLIRSLFSLPEAMKKRLEIGPDYETGEIGEDRNSMYYQAKNFIRNGNRDSITLLIAFLHASDGYTRMISAERVMRQAMIFIEACQSQSMAVETLKILRRDAMNDLPFSKEFFEDLILLALSKYSVPDASTNEKKYEFITTVFEIIDAYKENHELEIDSAKIKEKWTNMGHHDFCVLFLSHRFPILKESIPTSSYPWQSADVWSEDDKDEQQKKDHSDLKKYRILAKVPTAWPNCSDVTSVFDLVQDHVPQEISRLELYTMMEKYVGDEIKINDRWKKALLKAFSNRIAFLTPTEKNPKDPSEKKADEKKSKNKKKELPVEEIKIKEPPVEKIEITESPVEIKEPPVETKEPPEETKKPSVETEEPPVEIKEHPVETKKPPVKTKEPPVEKIIIKKRDAAVLVKEAKETQTSPIPQDIIKKPVEDSVCEKKEDEPVVVDSVEVSSEDVVKEGKEEDEEHNWEVVQITDIDKKETEEQEAAPIEESPEKMITPEPGKDAPVEIVVSEEVPEEVIVESSETSPAPDSDNTDTRKPLKELGEGVFYGWYKPEEWERLSDVITKEVYRQRTEHGYSNKL